MLVCYNCRIAVTSMLNIVTSVLDANKMRTFSQTEPHFGSSKVRGFNPTKFGSLHCTVEIETKAYRTYDGFYFIVFSSPEPKAHKVSL